MKVSYVYKKEHQEVIDKIQGRIDELAAGVEEQYKKDILVGDEILKSGVYPYYPSKVYPREYDTLCKELVYIMSVIVPEKIIIDEHSEVVL